MGDKVKVLCKWSKSRYVKDMNKLRDIVSEPVHVCEDCGRVAKDEKWLCKARKLR